MWYVEKISLSILSLYVRCASMLTIVVAWWLGKCQAIDWIVVYLFIWSTEKVSI